MARELDVLKEIPGYKAILKSVLKSQIQMLVSKSECIVQIESFFFPISDMGTRITSTLIHRTDLDIYVN